MKTITITQNNINKRLDNFLLKMLVTVPRSQIFKLIRSGYIKVNNKKVSISYHLQLNDVISLYLNIENSKFSTNNLDKITMKLDVLYEDNNIVIINKPIGILSQEDHQEKNKTIQNIFLKYLIDKKEYDVNNEDNFVPSICNRLDRNTSGIIIAAKNNATLVEINQLLKNHMIDKYYKCLVYGSPKRQSDTLIAYHYKNSNTNIVSIINHPQLNCKQIVTKYKLLAANQKYSMLEVQLITGRTHQIRAHLHHVGLSIVGDNKYRSKNTDTDSRIKNQALVSYKIKFNITNINSHLFYLNKKEIIIKSIWFEKYL